MDLDIKGKVIKHLVSSLVTYVYDIFKILTCFTLLQPIRSSFVLLNNRSFTYNRTSRTCIPKW